ncbi:MAG: hypothetical protein KF760_16995 [Candidatus Eremiobacteraeota bacterium]|nr:hypothetical protein [Candidatus Eremiobacteraeota bacterium]MCW5870136.1 hypothetical protein [Candidatus Eremiobacteraeota bacterium]
MNFSLPAARFEIGEKSFASTEDYVLVDQESLQLEAYRLIEGAYISQKPQADGRYDLEGDWLRLAHTGWKAAGNFRGKGLVGEATS